MKFGQITIVGGAQIENLIPELLSADPSGAGLLEGRLFYNTTSKALGQVQNGAVVTLATNVALSALQTTVANIVAAVGLNSDGTFKAFSGSHYVDSSVSVADSISKLDAQIYTVANDVNGAVTEALAALQTEVDLVETSVGLNADGSLPAFAGNYTAGAASVIVAVGDLDTQLKIATDSATAANTLAATKVNKAGDTLTGSLAFGGTSTVTGLLAPVDATDAATKAYVDQLVQGLSWLEPVKEMLADHTTATGLTAGDRIADTTSHEIFTWSGSAFDAGVAVKEGDAFINDADSIGYTFNGTDFVRFSSSLPAWGVGLELDGGTLNVALGAGIGQLPTNEVGIDLYATSGLFLTTDGSTASTDAAAQLAIKAGTAITVDASGVNVTAKGIVAALLGADVAGDGLAGGNGTALTAKADTGIVVSATGIAFDTTFGDARYADKTTTASAITALQTAQTAIQAQVNNSFATYTATAAATTHTFAHNLGVKFPSVTVYDASGAQMLPSSLTATDENTITIVVPEAMILTASASAVKASA